MSRWCSNQLSYEPEETRLYGVPEKLASTFLLSHRSADQPDRGARRPSRAPLSLACRAHDSAHFAEQRTRALHLRRIRYLDRELHEGGIAPAHRLHPDDIHLLARENFRDVAQ